MLQDGLGVGFLVTPCFTQRPLCLAQRFLQFYNTPTKGECLGTQRVRERACVSGRQRKRNPQSLTSLVASVERTSEDAALDDDTSTALRRLRTRFVSSRTRLEYADSVVCVCCFSFFISVLSRS